MHRVELKVFQKLAFAYYYFVPNAPCGVESNNRSNMASANYTVPNAPCGVERKRRVSVRVFPNPVPNAPCGVESQN